MKLAHLLLSFVGIAGITDVAPCICDASTAEFLGLWQGAIEIQKAEIEIDIIVDIAAQDDGSVRGTIDFPVRNEIDSPLHNLRIDSGTVTFEYHAGGDVSVFKGVLSEDGEVVEGTLDDVGNQYPFRIEKRDSIAAGSGVHPLSAGGAELREQFNRDAGSVRMVILLSPTCGTCKGLARATQRYALDQIEDEKLKTYVVWGPMLEGDNEAEAEGATVHLPDQRATHYWTATEEPVLAFSKSLGVEGGEPWDVFLLYGPEARWDDTVPVPVAYFHKNNDYPKDRQYNGQKFAEALRELVSSVQDRGTQ